MSNGATRWSTRSMARASGMSQCAFDQKPHLVETRTLSIGRRSIKTVRDVGRGLSRPTRGGDVLGVNKKSRIRLWTARRRYFP